MYSESSDITVTGKGSFLENYGYYGGAIQVKFKTKFSIKKNGQLEFHRNYCDHSGGGVMLLSESLWINEGRTVFRGPFPCHQAFVSRVHADCRGMLLFREPCGSNRRKRGSVGRIVHRADELKQ